MCCDASFEITDVPAVRNLASHLSAYQAKPHTGVKLVGAALGQCRQRAWCKVQSDIRPLEAMGVVILENTQSTWVVLVN